MARIRTIKPEFWVDEKIVELSPWARLLFIGLWNFCDDAGRMELKEKKIKMQIFPADEQNISELIGELRRESVVLTYTVEDKEYLQIINFDKHQKVDRRTESKLPPPPKSADFPRIPPTDQGREGIKEGIKEGKGSRKTSLPGNFTISDRVRQWAEEKGHNNLEAHLENFKLQCEAKGYQYKDWDAAFMNAVRNNWAKIEKRGRDAPDIYSH